MDAGTLVAIIMFAGASISDLQTRRVPNSFWLPFLVAALFLALGRNIAGTQNFTSLAFALGAVVVFYLLWRLGLFGGADGKGLMVVAALTPTTPALFGNQTVLALDALINATFLMLALPVLFLIWNLAHKDASLPAAFLGVRMELATARRRYLWPMQEATPGGLKWRFLNKPGDDVESRFASLARAGVTRVWVTPKVPFMVPLWVGLIVAAYEGNLVLWAMALILG